MRPRDRVELINQIGTVVQERWTFPDIDEFLKAHGIDVTSHVWGDSKRTYAKRVLGTADDDTIIKVAEDLDLPLPTSAVRSFDVEQVHFWTHGHFRLFISHVAAFKAQAASVRDHLRQYGISAFVAHEDIEPTNEVVEIEKALFTMDALAALLTANFHESKWTDHEVGVAIGRDKLVVPVIRDVDPYGLFGKYQGLKVGAGKKNTDEVAKEVFLVLGTNPRTADRLGECLAGQIISAPSVRAAQSKLKALSQIKLLNDKHLVQVRENVTSNPLLVPPNTFIQELDAMLIAKGLDPVEKHPPSKKVEDDVPF
jgi:hypothetical protein